MTVQAATLNGISLLQSDSALGGGRYTYLCSLSFPAYTGSGDSASFVGVCAAINASTKDGKTRTFISSCVPTCVGPGQDTNGQAVYIGAVTISTNDLTFNLTAADGTTELTTATASQGVQLAVTVLEA